MVSINKSEKEIKKIKTNQDTMMIFQNILKIRQIKLP